MARVTTKHIPAFIIVLIVLGLALPPFINVGRYRSRIAASMSAAMGRPVTFDSISLRLLPQPGFDFENLVIGDDPGYSAEPILRADEVTAYLRLGSLWRGKMEIARLSLRYPSLNLVRRGESDWNLESLLNRAAQVPAAPTTATHAEARPRFPYIEAQDGRINFKYGLEKQVFSFTDAKFALWSQSQDEWRMRLQAKPVRTDLVVADTGMLRAEGSFRRSNELRNTPLTLKVTLERGQLGQLSKLIDGSDRGWRGSLNATMDMTGTPADLKVTSAATVQDLRRFDIMRGEAITVNVACDLGFSSVSKIFSNINCRVPAAPGAIVVKGNVTGWHANAYDLGVVAEGVPTNWLTALARHAKRDMPDDLTAAGTVSANFTLKRDAQTDAATITGRGTFSELILRSSVLETELPLGRIDFQSASEKAPKSAKNPKQVVSTPAVQVLPFALPLGGASPAAVTASVSHAGYHISIQGDGTTQRMLEVSRALGIGVPKIQIKGTAHVSADIAGVWAGFARPDANGTLQLHNASAEVPGVSAPVKLASADVTLNGQQFVIKKLAGSVGENVKFAGAATFPRWCEEDQPCASQANIQFDDVDLDNVNALLNPSLKSRPWYKLFGSNSGERSLVMEWQAQGQLSARRITVHGVSASKVSANFDLNKGHLILTDLTGDILGGKHNGRLTADFTGKTPSYSGSGVLAHAASAQLAALTKDSWGTGPIDLKYEAVLSGSTTPEFAKSAEVKGDFAWSSGTLRHVAFDGHSGALQFAAWNGQFEWDKAGLRLATSKMTTRNSIYTVSGSVRPDKKLQLRFQGDGSAYDVTGTLEKPEITPAAPAAHPAEASLKQ